MRFGSLEVVHQTPSGDNRIARSRAEGPPAAARWRGRARPHRDPAISGREPPTRGWGPRPLWRVSPALGRGPEPDVPRRRPCRSDAPLGSWRGARGREQRPVAARAPHPTAVAHVPPRSALGTHLNHFAPRVRTIISLLACAGSSDQPSGEPSDDARSAVVGDHRAAGTCPGQHAAADVDRRVAVAGQILSHPL
jgi:hypothetical protein